MPYIYDYAQVMWIDMMLHYGDYVMSCQLAQLTVD